MQKDMRAAVLHMSGMLWHARGSIYAPRRFGLLAPEPIEAGRNPARLRGGLQ